MDALIWTKMLVELFMCEQINDIVYVRLEKQHHTSLCWKKIQGKNLEIKLTINQLELNILLQELFGEHLNDFHFVAIKNTGFNVDILGVMFFNKKKSDHKKCTETYLCF